MTIFGYVRVSGITQADKDGPVRQEKAVTEYAARHYPGKVVHFFYDKGVSGTKEGLNRPGFGEMFGTAVEGDVIIVENLDRLARDLMVQEVIIEELRKSKIVLRASDQETDNLVVSDPNGDPTRVMIRQIFGVVAQFAKSTLVLRLRAARERKEAATGKRCGGMANWLQHSQDGRVTVSLITQLRRDGVSWEGIAVQLNLAEVKKRRGNKKWHQSEVRRFYHKYGHLFHNQSGQSTDGGSGVSTDPAPRTVPAAISEAAKRLFTRPA